MAHPEPHCFPFAELRLCTNTAVHFGAHTHGQLEGREEQLAEFDKICIGSELQTASSIVATTTVL